MEYRCVATSVEGFVQQLAVAYVTHGYWFYVMGEIPEHKDPVTVDRKLVERYGIAISKWARARRKRQGHANIQYLRHERTFVLLATKGRHEFFDRERGVFRDIRRVPIKFASYSVACRKGRDGRWHASVRIEPNAYRELQAYFESRACRAHTADLGRELGVLPVEPYAGVRRQLLGICRRVNRVRRALSMGLIDHSALRLRRRCARPYGD